MPQRGRLRGLAAVIIGALALGLTLNAAAGIGGSRRAAGPGLSMERLVRMDGCELEGLYRRSIAGPVPAGKVRGRALVSPGSRLAPVASGAARVMWQGKVFEPADSTAINRFFGLRAVRGEVSYGPSWTDGAPSIILDYSRTSRIYAKYRDEIRQVAPGLYLGVMYERTCPPRPVLYFALEACP